MYTCSLQKHTASTRLKLIKNMIAFWKNGKIKVFFLKQIWAKTDSLWFRNGTHVCYSGDRKRSFSLEEITLSSLSPQTHTLTYSPAHTHGGRWGRTAGVYSEDVTSTQNCHSQFTHLPTDNSIQSHTEPHMTWAYVHMHGQICNKNLSLRSQHKYLLRK